MKEKRDGDIFFRAVCQARGNFATLFFFIFQDLCLVHDEILLPLFRRHAFFLYGKTKMNINNEKIRCKMIVRMVFVVYNDTYIFCMLFFNFFVNNPYCCEN